MAYPGKSLLTISSKQYFLCSKSTPPCTIPNRFYLEVFLWAVMQRSIHLIVLWLASIIRE
jgi:hypothetical protein